MKRVTAVVALAGGACVSSALSGACSALTTIPPLVMLVTGIALIATSLCSCRRASCSRASAACPFAILGAALGLLLPTAPPPIAGDVVTRAPGGAIRGDLFDVLDTLDADPARVFGRRVSVSGEWAPAASHLAATVSRRIMSCCAADAIAVGFDVEAAHAIRLRKGSWVRVDGIVVERMRNGERRLVLEQSNITGLEDPSGTNR